MLPDLPSGDPTGHPVKPIPTVVPTPDEFFSASATGYRALWAVFVVMVLASAVFVALAWRLPASKRLYHIITTLTTITAALAYLAMATGQGTAWQCVRVTDHHHKHIPDVHHLSCRSVFWARYVDWAITTPLLLLDLCLLAGINGATTLTAIIADVVMVLAGLFAALGRQRNPQYKWAWFAIACLAYIVVVWQVALHGITNARTRGTKTRALFGSLAVFTLILWTIYPIVWGLGDGSRRLSVDGEIIAFAVLDILAKAVFGLWLLIAHRAIPESNADLHGFWAHGLNEEGRIRLGLGGDNEEGA